MYYIGIDTSAYTTSLAIVDKKENLIKEAREPIKVKEGKRGIRQSEAVFEHLRQLPPLWEKLFCDVSFRHWSGVCVSEKPRPISSSYMPVFKVGEAFGRFLAQTLGIPYQACSHQENHLMAGFWSLSLPEGEYLALHLSGGTTELLKVKYARQGIDGVALLGGTKDLSAGQFVDRVGQALGFSFPAGPEIEKLAQGAAKSIALTVAVDDTWFSFSGPASQAMRYKEQGIPPADLARGVEDNIALTLKRSLKNALLFMDNCQGVLMVGGVASNYHISQQLKENISVPVYVTPASYAQDNAVGNALLAAR